MKEICFSFHWFFKLQLHQVGPKVALVDGDDQGVVEKYGTQENPNAEPPR